MNENLNESKSVFTVKNILRGLSLLGIILVFCPAFLVSCSEQDVNVSVMTAVKGVSMYGEEVVEPYPIMLICLLLPVATLVFLILKKFTEKMTTLIVLGCSAVDLVIWLIFRSSVKKIAEENMCGFKSTAWFFFQVISLLVMILLAVLVVLGKMQMDTDVKAVLSGSDTQKVLSQMSDVVGQMSNTVSKMVGDVASNVGNKVSKEDIIGYCSKCGKPLVYGNKFCTSCGATIPESMLVEAELAKKAAEAEAARLAAEQAVMEEPTQNEEN